MTGEDGWHRWLPMKVMIAPPDLWGSTANVVSTPLAPLQGPNDDELTDEWANKFGKGEKVTVSRHHQV